jgi:hypothetical protein
MILFVRSCKSLPRFSTSWSVLATDGASELLSHLGIHDWHAIATCSVDQLTLILASIHSGEGEIRPTGEGFTPQHVPRRQDPCRDVRNRGIK